MRKAGILMPIFSLPSPYGIGTMGQAAYDFIDFLEKAGQSCWQILPVGQTGYGDSPYQSFSSYAGNPYFIDLDMLAEDGLLRSEEYQKIDWGTDPKKVDYALQYTTRYNVLNKACWRLLERNDKCFGKFCSEHADWLNDYALYMAIKGKNGSKSWFEWPKAERLRQPEALKKAEQELKNEVACWKAIQYLFFTQWNQMKSYANKKGIQIIGDLPIYVSGDSADVWANPQYFQLDEMGNPIAVAGCPPDDFSEDGQLWGNPLFDWERLKKDGYRWWLDRIQFQFRIYDTLRIDHFRGFDEYYAIPYGAKNAKNGHWCPGPGLEFFETVNKTLGKRDIIAEDLGFLTESVHKLQRDTGYPGMKILEFAFDSKEKGSDYLPHCYDKHCVVYAGTHDNDTIMGWMENAPQKDVEYAKEYLRLNKEEGYNWGMMRGAWASPADLAVIQFQDVLGLGSEARINIPSTLGENWQWRALPGVCTPELAQKLYRDTEVYQRLPKKEKQTEKPARRKKAARRRERNGKV